MSLVVQCRTLHLLYHEEDAWYLLDHCSQANSGIVSRHAVSKLSLSPLSQKQSAKPRLCPRKKMIQAEHAEIAIHSCIVTAFSGEGQASPDTRLSLATQERDPSTRCD